MIRVNSTVEGFAWKTFAEANGSRVRMMRTNLSIVRKLKTNRQESFVRKTLIKIIRDWRYWAWVKEKNSLWNSRTT